MLACQLELLLAAEESRAPQGPLLDQGDVYPVGRLRLLDSRLHSGIILVAGVRAGKDDDEAAVEASSQSELLRYSDSAGGVANVG